MELRHNKLCEYEDFANGDLAAAICDIFAHEARRLGGGFPNGFEYRKYWEIAMSVRALRQFGALNRDSLVLGVGAGTESTLFYLTRFAKLVFATDVYIQQDGWSPFAPTRMLWDPEAFAPFPFEEQRLIVQHMDGRFLNYPDNLFDGIFSSGSIEHFGGLQDAAYSAYEMGRVLKPGGIMTVSTEFCVAGPSRAVEWPGLVLFSEEQLQKYIVEASGLEPVDQLSTNLSESTRATVRPLSFYVAETNAALRSQGNRPRVAELTWSTYPHILVEQHGYTFGSVHLTLRKPDRYPVCDNAWARPTPETIREKRWRPKVDQPAAPQGPVRKITAEVKRFWRRLTRS